MNFPMTVSEDLHPNGSAPASKNQHYCCPKPKYLVVGSALRAVSVGAREWQALLRGFRMTGFEV